MIALASVTRALAATFWFVTALYVLLASQPFAHEHFLQPGLVPAIALFARYHRAIATVSVVLYAGAHVIGFQRWPRTAQITIGIAGGVLAVVAAGLWMAPPLASLGPGRVADALVLAALFPPLLLALVDLSLAKPIDRARPETRTASDFVACACAAVAASAISAALGFANGAGVTKETLAGITSTALLQSLVFATVFLSLTVVRAITALAGSRVIEIGGATLLLGGSLFVTLWRIVLPGLVTEPSRAVGLAAAFAGALTAALTARGLQASTTTDDPVARVLGALAPRAVRLSRARAIGWLALIGLAAFGISAASGIADWNFIVARLGVVLTWFLVLSAFLSHIRVAAPGRPLILFASTVTVLVIHVVWTTTADRVLAAAGMDRPSALHAWATRDPATRLLTDALRPAVSSTDDELFDFLQAHTNLPPSVQIAPVDITLSTSAATVASYRPHVFLFVVDSLRRDYVGAYNQAVTFTPAIDRFSAESTVFARAFTRYGATGLSVPSIWTGGMLLHKQYVTPFAPMNTLAKLLEGQRYTKWIGMDHIMQAILPDSARRDPLDARRTVKDVRFCGTLDEIRARLAAKSAADDPVFVYSLPQDIHVSAIMREGNRALDAQAYPGFYAPVASRIRRFDSCFGAFIDDLKIRGLYDDSVIILTSDHGDSLGEDGRTGHAYTLYPEIVQVPLIVRVPPRLADSLTPEKEGVVFTTDITPTLYSLLGAAPRHQQLFMGLPLFRARGSAPRDASAMSKVIAASYGAVYAALFDGGRSLYILDSVNLREYSYELDGSGSGRPAATTTEQRTEGQQQIRATVELIADFYGFHPSR